jgi:hypothetical protein
MKLLQSALISFFLASLVQAREEGSPICLFTKERMRNGHGDESPGAPFNLAVDPKQDGSFEIKVTGSETFRGILLFVTGAKENEHLGSFEISNQKDFKFIPGTCKVDEVQESSAQSTLTHSNQGPKDSAQNVFKWKPLPGDLAKQGPFKVEAIITGGEKPWKKVASIPINLKAPEKPNPPNPAAPQEYAAVPTTSKAPCTKTSSTTAANLVTAVPPADNYGQVLPTTTTTQQVNNMATPTPTPTKKCKNKMKRHYH